MNSFSRQERDEIEAELGSLLKHLNEMETEKKEEEEVPMMILQKAQADLKKRYSKMKLDRDGMKQELEELLQRKVGIV